MKIDELLSEINKVAASNNLSKPYLVGGVPRDRVLGQIGEKSEIQDVDITTGDKDAEKIAQLFNQKYPDSIYKKYDDGHTSIDFLGLHIDFSSNFVAPGVDLELKRLKIEPTPMKMELYSRDFTMNTLLEDLDFTSIYDLTGEGMGDLKAGLIRTPINPNITIGVDPRRILRAIKFAIKYDFKLEDGLRSAMLEHRKKIQNLPKRFVQTKATEIVLLNADKGLDMLIEFKLLPLIPLTKTLSDLLIQRRQLVKAL